MASLSAQELRTEIKEILRGADLQKLSTKKVRKQLEAKHDIDFSERKQEIDEVVMELITQDGEESQEEEASNVNGHKNAQDKEPVKKEQDIEPDESEESDFEAPEDISPPRKKQKTGKKKSSSDDEEDDEEIARKLQLEEEEDTGRRRTRGSRKAAPVKKNKPKKKREPSNRPNRYIQECMLSPALSELMGTEKMARSDVVKKMWEIIKARDLRDPKNGQFMICDEELQKVFGRKRVKTFGMMKFLQNHIFSPEEYDQCFTKDS